MLVFMFNLILFAVCLFLLFIGFAIGMTALFAKRNPIVATYWANVVRRILDF